jgi:hypothetical protein
MKNGTESSEFHLSGHTKQLGNIFKISHAKETKVSSVASIPNTSIWDSDMKCIHMPAVLCTSDGNELLEMV